MKKLKITVNNQSYIVTVEEVRESALQAVEPKSVVPRTVYSRPSIVQLPSKQPAASGAAKGDGNSVTAPMPGVVLAVRFKEGDTVKTGDVIVVLEAMKMENEITTKKGGVIREIRVQEGQTVAGGEVLAIID